MAYYMDPVSLITSKIIPYLNESNQKRVMSFYYTIYNELIPTLFDLLKNVWSQAGALYSYVVITRIGKRFCPYLIRWHWTFLILLQMVERPITVIIYRAYFFTFYVLKPQVNFKPSSQLSEFLLQLKYYALQNVVIISIIFHLVLVFLGCLHALFGQYFYVPFLVPNTELHVGLRPVNSVYSQGKTPWQDQPEIQDRFLKPWYSWSDSTKSKKFWSLKPLKRLIKELLKKLKRKKDS